MHANRSRKIRATLTPYPLCVSVAYNTLNCCFYNLKTKKNKQHWSLSQLPIPVGGEMLPGSGTITVGVSVTRESLLLVRKSSENMVSYRRMIEAGTYSAYGLHNHFALAIWLLQNHYGNISTLSNHERIM